jgi:cytochrome P450
VLVDAERRGVLTRRQLYGQIHLLVDAGHETTINLICNGLLALIRHPQQWDLLRADPDGLSALATEECLRYDPSGSWTRRISNQDQELGGKLIRAGDYLLAITPAANRDPRVFRDPDRLEITRSPNPHVMFGGGIHHCLGAAMARLEGQEVFRALAQRFPRLQLESEEDIEYEKTQPTRQLKSLPVRWSRTAPIFSRC